MYDLNMMLNTYDGQCHDAARIVEWLQEAGMNHPAVRDLQTDTSVIIGGFDSVPLSCTAGNDDWPLFAMERVYPLGLARVSSLILPDFEKHALAMNLHADPWPVLKEMATNIQPDIVMLSFRNIFT